MPTGEGSGPRRPRPRRVRFAEPSGGPDDDAAPPPDFDIHIGPFGGAAAALPPQGAPPPPSAAAAGPQPDMMGRPRRSSRVVELLQARGSRAAQLLQSAAYVALPADSRTRSRALPADPFSRYNATLRCRRLRCRMCTYPAASVHPNGLSAGGAASSTALAPLAEQPPLPHPFPRNNHN